MIQNTLIVRVTATAFLLTSAGCAGSQPQVDTDLNAGLEIAVALESAYAAEPTADPKIVAQAKRLVSTAEAAVTSFTTSTAPADQAAALAAIAALVAYEASSHLAP